MFRFKMWMLLGPGAALVLAPLWGMFIMQVHLTFLNSKMIHLQKKMQESQTYAREFLIAYQDSQLSTDIRKYFTFSKSEVRAMDQLSQEDSEVVEHIRQHLLIPPPKFPQRRTLEDTSKGQAEKILNHFKNMTGGFYIECGAMDGIYLSNTLFLESKYNWTGLLIEGEPGNFRKLLQAERNAWLLPSCLSLKKSPLMVTFGKFGAWAKITDDGAQLREVHCMPLYSILLAMNRTSIDFFSLDIEGSELDVLRTLPFDLVDIKTLAVEHSNIKEGREHLLEFMLGKGYYSLSSTAEEREGQWAQEDFIFIKK